MITVDDAIKDSRLLLEIEQSDALFPPPTVLRNFSINYEV